jgi:hypothetical protein
MSGESVLGKADAAGRSVGRSAGKGPGTCSAAGTGFAGTVGTGAGKCHQDWGKRPGYSVLLAPGRHSTDSAWGMAVGYSSS